MSHDPARSGISLRASAARFAPALFAATLFASALLLFAGSRCSPRWCCRSSAARFVWSVAMVFFQGALLIGYAYAHLLARTLSVGQGALVHLGVSRRGVDPADRIAHGLRRSAFGGRRALARRSVRGFDRIALRGAVGKRAAAAKLVRRKRASPGAQSLCPLCRLQPRFVCALLAYPLALESLLTLRAQAWVWSVGFRRPCDLIATAAIIAARGAKRSCRRACRIIDARRGATASRGLALAAVPAGLVIAVTAYISTESRPRRSLGAAARALSAHVLAGIPRQSPGFRTISSSRSCVSWSRPLADHLAWRRPRILARHHGANLLALFVLALGATQVYARVRRRAANRVYLWTRSGVIGRRLAGLLGAASVQSDLRVSDPRPSPRCSRCPAR